MSILPDGTIKHVNRYTTTPSGLDLYANFEYPPAAKDKGPRGIFVAYHGGGIITGSREEEFIYQPVAQAIRDNGYILCKPGYRLLVPSTGHQILSDVTSLITYLSSPQYLSSLPPGFSVDLSKIIVSGFSGGGYPARLAAIKMTELAQQQPESTVRCVGCVIYFGMGGDVLHEKWARSKPEMQGGTGGKEPDDVWKELEKLYKGREISDCSYTPGLKGWEDKEERDVIWGFWEKYGLLPDILAGTKGEIRKAIAGVGSTASPSDKVAAILTEHHPIFPQIWLDNPSNAAAFPPTIMLHGTDDEAVPIEESELTAQQLMRGGKAEEDRQFVRVEGANHNLQDRTTGVDVEGTKGAHERVIEFTKARLG